VIRVGLGLSITMRIRCIHLVLFLALAVTGESLSLRRRKKEIDKNQLEAKIENDLVMPIDSQPKIELSMKKRRSKITDNVQDKDKSSKKRKR
jgi:hypothetical protein